jgi:hypothetical protein
MSNLSSPIVNTNPFPDIPEKEQYNDFAEIKIDRSSPNFFYIGKKSYFKKYEIHPTSYTIASTPIYLDFTSLFPNDGLNAWGCSMYCFEQAYNDNNIMLLAFNAMHSQAAHRVFRRNTNGIWEQLPPISINVDNGNGNGVAVAANPLQWRYFTDISFNPNDDTEIWASISGWSQYGSSLRVIHSTDGGNTWEDFSEGLTAAPINAIVYQEGSNGVLFAATDVGVYRYNPTPGIEKWECFNQGFPVSLVNDLEISTCENRIYASAYGRGIWESPLPPLERCDIATNTTWDTDREVLATTVVKSGKRLTIKNCTVNMARGTSIIVEPGAEFVINNATLTNGCGEMWDGIVVKGNANASQYGSFPNNAQGKVVLRNNARVEYALNAVRLWDAIDGGGISKAGGIVQANSVTFLNNQRDIEFMKYENVNPTTGNYARNLSYFQKCTFELDDDYRGADLDSRVTMWAVDGINFNGCTFINNNVTLQQTYQKAGIYSIDAGYDIDIHCNGAYAGPCPANKTVKSSFDNFYYGVRATIASGNKTVSIKNAEFNHNFYGVLTQNMNDVNITKSTFDIGNTWGINTAFNYGVYIETGTRYDVQENTFTNTNNFPLAIGTYLMGTGPDENKIRKNDFDNLFVANLAYGTNRHDVDDYKGLQYLCNTQTNNDYDIAVVNDLGIRGLQGGHDGDNFISDGNHFSRNSNTSEGDYFYDETIPKSTNRHPQSSVTTEQASDYTTLKVLQIANGIEADCSSQLDDGGAVVIDDPAVGGRPALTTDFNNHETDFIAAVYLYDNLIDGGNSAAMSNNVQFNWSADAWILRDELIAESPNLSQEVLLDAAFTGVLPDALLMEVLLANPNSVRDEEFLFILENEIQNPLPRSMTDLLRIAQETEMVRTDLERQMGHHHYQKSQIGHLLVSGILRDSVPNNDSLQYWLNRLNTYPSQLNLAENYLANGEYQNGLNLINGLNGNQYSYIDRYNTEFQAYQQLFTLKTAIVQSDRTWLDITESEKGQLQNIAYATNAEAAVQARNILCFFFEECSNPIAAGPTNGNNNRIIQVNDPKLELTKQLTSIQVYPNPARDYVTFEYRLPEYMQSATITVVDITGKVVLNVGIDTYEGQYLWDTRTIENGFYFINLKDDKGQTLLTEKLSIIK